MKVGIFSGSFDPVHAGHIAFALQAAEVAELDKVYFLPEQIPRRKVGVTHYAHRIAMLKLALKLHPKLKVLDITDKQFSVNRTLPKIKKLLPSSELYFLVGSDMIDLLLSDNAPKQWPDYENFLSQVTLITGVREEKQLKSYTKKSQKLQPKSIVITSKRPYASSRDIRSAVARGKEHNDLLQSLKSYIKENWLYASVEAVPNSS